MPKRKSSISFYKLNEVREKVNSGLVIINENASQRAFKDFGWEAIDILDAIKKLRPNHYLKTAESEKIYSVKLDFYKGYINGENIYTHFYFSDDLLIINSFHKP